MLNVWHIPPSASSGSFYLGGGGRIHEHRNPPTPPPPKKKKYSSDFCHFIKKMLKNGKYAIRVPVPWHNAHTRVSAMMVVSVSAAVLHIRAVC